jgi:hypothetical protein
VVIHHPECPCTLCLPCTCEPCSADYEKLIAPDGTEVGEVFERGRIEASMKRIEVPPITAVDVRGFLEFTARALLARSSDNGEPPCSTPGCDQDAPVLFRQGFSRCAAHAVAALLVERDGQPAEVAVQWAVVHRATSRYVLASAAVDADLGEALAASLDELAEKVHDELDRRDAAAVKSAREAESVARSMVLENQRWIAEWPRHHRLMLALRVLRVLILMLAVALPVITGAAVVAFVMSVLLLITDAKILQQPRLDGQVRGSKAHRRKLVSWRDEYVEAHGEALAKLVETQASVPVYVAYPELHPEGRLRLPPA